MWLRRWVGISLIIACFGMNGIILYGFFAPEEPAVVMATPVATPSPVVVPPPTVQIVAKPSTITAGANSALSWTTTGSAESCAASGAWSGPKTAFGAESTGRITKPGNYTYVLTCQNGGGTATASTVVNVGGVAPVAAAKPTTVTAAPAASYCGGRSPCYGPKDLAAHASAGNCWGYNVDRVINLTSFDTSYHAAKSGISTIELSSVCGKNLAPALAGQVSAGGQTRDHNATSKNNADRNMIPYFVGYYDATKP